MARERWHGRRITASAGGVGQVAGGELMASGNLYRDNLATTMHETRRTHWLVWVFMWSMLLGCVLGIYGMTCEALSESQRRDVMYGEAR